MFTSQEVFPGIFHITDAMGVSFTLLTGSERALLIDTGYGLEDAAAYVHTLTSRPVVVLLTHGHHDHALGARWFPFVQMSAEDLPVFRLRTAAAQRARVLEQAAAKGLCAPDDFLTAPIPDPDPVVWDRTLAGFPCRVYNPGGLEILAVQVPGHTPGSIMLFVPEYGLLLTGDDWNPCTWMWFPESLSVVTWRKNMRAVLPAIEKETGAGISHVLCSHQPAPREGAELREYLDYMSDERLDSAPSVDMNSPVRTRQVTCPARDWVLVFDAAK